MIKALLTILLSAFALAAHAAPKDKFSCKQIADKAVRESCVAAMKDKTSVDSTDYEKLKIDRFVSEAKARLTVNFKDPLSAQFTNVLYIEKGIMDSSYLCGFVNAKNSYGGYVGGKMFVVRKQMKPLGDDPGPVWSTWIASDEASTLEALLAEQAVAQCTSAQAVSIN